jgi:bifunctional non-homologous end joining protein LigD
LVPVAYQRPDKAIAVTWVSPHGVGSHGKARRGRIEEEGLKVLQQACAMELEGVVSKRKESPYRSGRNSSWTKVTCWHRETFVLVGGEEIRRRVPRPAGRQEADLFFTRATNADRQVPLQRTSVEQL